MKKIYMLFLAFILVGCDRGNNMEPEPQPDKQYTNIDRIEKDAALGQYNYVGRTVRIKGIVERAADSFNSFLIPHKYQITIETKSSEVEFFILGDKVVLPVIEPNKPINEYKQNYTYHFYVFISEIIPHRYIPNAYRIISHLIVDDIRLNIDTFVSDVRLKNQEHRYIDNIIHLEGGAEVISRPWLIRVDEPEVYLPEEIYLKTIHDDVSFVVEDYSVPKNLRNFKDGINHHIVLFIESFGEDTDPRLPIYTWINSIIVWNESGY